MACICCCSSECCLDEDARAQLRVSRAIDREIEQWKRDQPLQFKLVLLGAENAGKSTFCKQMRIIYGQAYSDKDQTDFRYLVYRNIFDAMQDLIRAMAVLKIPYADLRNKKYESVLMGVRGYEATEITAEQKVAIQSLWKDTGVQRCFEKRENFQISDCAKYYFDSIERICEADYIPTIDDVLRVPTAGIDEYTFQLGKLNFRIMDAGGSLSDRKKKIRCFEDLNGIIFFCAINEYNKVLFEDMCTSRMRESLALFESIICSKFFQQCTVILFLNKTDLFLEEIMKSHLTDYFPAYQGPKSDPEAAKQFIMQMFLSVNPDPDNRRIFCYFTQATDAENMKRVFQDVREHLLEENLKDYNLM